MKSFEKIATILFELSGIENIQAEDSLQADIGLDSLQMITLLIMIEEDFQIILDESDMNPFDLITVSNVIDLVEKYVGDAENEQKKED